MSDFLICFCGTILFLLLLWLIPYLIRHGWRKARNDTVKVCDICWRDIERVHKSKTQRGK